MNLLKAVLGGTLLMFEVFGVFAGITSYYPAAPAWFLFSIILHLWRKEVWK